MAGEDTIELLVEGGKAAPDAGSAPKISAHKLNIGDVFKKINEKTAEYRGMQVPVKVVINKELKTFEVRVGTPPVSSLIKKELGIEKAKTEAAEKREEELKKAQDARKETEKSGKEGGARAVAEAGEKKEEEEGKEVGAEEGLGKAGAAEKEGKEEAEAAAAEAAAVEEVVGNLTMEQVVKIAKLKRDDLLAKNLKSAAKQVVGTAVSMMGIHVEGKKPKEAIKDIDGGKYDNLFEE